MAHNTHNPEAIGKYIRKHGWECDTFKSSSAQCPKCLEKRRLARRGESPKEEVVTIAPKEVTPLARKLTPDEKFRVRQLLDAKFDEQKGFYLDAYSDQRIGAETNVPWINVRELREAAYGPIKAIPEMDALLAESTALLERSNTLAKEAVALQNRILEFQRKMGLG